MTYVFKFGGASVKDAAAVTNVASILRRFPDHRIVVVVSAMDKTTNALEEVVAARFGPEGRAGEHLDRVRRFHQRIVDELFPRGSGSLPAQLESLFTQAGWALDQPSEKGYDFCYDQVVSLGEQLSTAIISEYLTRQGLPNVLADVRDYIRTDDTWREGRVDWDVTAANIRTGIPALWDKRAPLVVTQGFIGCTSENYTTTLGREGSDFTAAIFAHCLEADAVMIWKDVPGVLNADPKFFPDVQKLDTISYLDAIELAYFGASVIHPKTIKPLENKNITLHVKSFLYPEASGTAIRKDAETKPLIPSFIFKNDQVLISLSAMDFSFIAEDSLSEIFGLFARHRVRINLMQNSAVSFSVCVDDNPVKVPPLIAELQKRFKVLYNENLQLYTIRHYYASTIDRLSQGKEILLEQRSRSTVQLVMRDATATGKN